MLRKLSIHVLAAAAILALATSAHATLLPAGATVVPDISDETGTFVDATSFQSFSVGSGTPTTGTVKEAVYQNGSFFDFVYQFTVNSGPGIEHLTGSSFKNFHVINVSQTANVPAGTTWHTPTNRAAQDANRSSDGSVVSFNFSPAVRHGTGPNSYILIVRTNATTYGSGSIGIIDGGGTEKPGFAPAGASGVPEPSSLVLFGGMALGLGGAAFRRWKRQPVVA
jgi:hypothetical protein